MVRCSVLGCKSDGENKLPDVSFHSFPENENTRQKWIEATGRTDWAAKLSSRICSRHFLPHELIKKKKITLLLPNAVPSQDNGQTNGERKANILPDYLTDASSHTPKCTEVPVPICKGGFLVISSSTTNKEDAICRDEICRVCLGCDRTLHEMQRSGLEEPYVQLTGVNPRSSAALPQAVCGYCAHLLRKFHKLQQSALLANDTLHSLLREHGQVSEDLLAAVDIKPNPFLLVARAQPPTSCVPTEHLTSDSELKIETDSFIDNDEALSNNDDIDGKLNDHDLNSKIELVDEFSETPPNNDKMCKSEELIENLDFNILSNNKDSVGSDSSSSPDFVESNQPYNSDKKTQPEQRMRPNPTTQANTTDITRKNGAFLENFTVAQFTPEEQRAHILKRKDAENYKSSPYKCEFCFRGFILQETFELHLKKHTDIAKYGTHACAACKMLYRGDYKLLQHVHNSHAVRYSCRRCSFVTVTKTLAKEHNSIHEGKKYPCSLCAAVYDSKSGYLSHLRIVHPSNVVCELCGYSFINVKGLNFHKKLKHRNADHQLPPDAPACALCDVKFISEAALRTHQLVSPKHQGPEGRKYRNDSTRSYWIKRRHEPTTTTTPQLLQCDKCDAQFPSQREYFNHFRARHPGETRARVKARRRAVCEVCGRVLKSNWHLRDHMTLHAAGAAASWQCPKCPKTFKTKSKMFAHKTTTHRKENTECSVCGKIIRHHCNIRRHMMTHSAEKPVGCGSCDQRFTDKAAMSSHYRHKHLGVPYPTKKCKRRRRPPVDSSMENQSVPAEDLLQNEPEEH